MAIVYVSRRTYGSKHTYHTDRDCPRLRGNVRAVELHKVNTKSECKRCSGEKEDNTHHGEMLVTKLRKMDVENSQ